MVVGGLSLGGENGHNYVREYNEQRPDSGKYPFGKTPVEIFIGLVPLANEKMLDSTLQTEIPVSD